MLHSSFMQLLHRTSQGDLAHDLLERSSQTELAESNLVSQYFFFMFLATLLGVSCRDNELRSYSVKLVNIDRRHSCFSEQRAANKPELDSWTPHWRSRRQNAPPNPWLPPTCQPRTELFASHKMMQGQGVWLDGSSGFKFILDLTGFYSAAVTIPKCGIPPFLKINPLAFFLSLLGSLTSHDVASSFADFPN